MNLTNYYWYFQSAIPERICDDIVKYGHQLQHQMAVTGGYGDGKKLNQKQIKDLKTKRAYTSFGHCSQAKADIDYIFKDKHETVVVVAECYTEEGYKSYLEDMQRNKDKGRKLLEIK